MFHFFMSPLKRNKSGRGAILDDYILYDQFTTDVAAGSVNGTSAEPVGGARTVTDTNSKISIAGGFLSFASGAVNWDGLYYPIQERTLGRTYILNVNYSAGFIRLNANNSPTIGTYDLINVNGVIQSAYAYFFTAFSAIPTSTDSRLALTQRSVGQFFFAKSGTESFKLVWVSSLGNANTYPGISISNTSVGTSDFIRVPKRLYIPAPLESDGMSAETTDGAGHAESATNGASVAGHAYTNIGAWGVSGGARSCSALSGGLGFSYLATLSSNVIIDAEVTRSAGVAGIVARYADASNYLIAYHDGTNAKLDKVVAGVTTNLISAAATYSAGAVLRLILDGTSARLFYNNAAVGSVATTPAAGSLNHGLYTTDTGNTFDDLTIWARGNEGQYSGLDSL